MLKEKEKIVEDNIPLVHSLCRRFSGRGIEYDDLFGAGCEGLCKAAKKFDQSKGFCFSTYAVPVILGEIKRLFRDGGSIKVSRSIKELYLKTVRVQNELSEKMGREPTVNEIAAALSVTPEQVNEALCAARPSLSLTMGDEDGEGQIDLPDLKGQELENKIMIKAALSKLDGFERTLIDMRYFKGLTQSETAKRLNVTQVQISRNEKKILLKLRENVS